MVQAIIIGFAVFLFITALLFAILILKKPELFNKNMKNGEVVSADNNTSNPGGIGEIIGDTKDFVPVRGFEDFAFAIGKYDYRAIVECTSVNFDLMNEMEQEIIEKSYRRFLNSLNFPITQYTQTREIDVVGILENLEKSIKSSCQIFPGISNYADSYYANMSYLPEHINNSLMKKKYIIIPFNSGELEDVSALTSDEIKEFILEEIWSRSNIVKAGIEGIGLSASILDKREICECLYSYYHRNTYRIAYDFLDGGYNSLVINGNGNYETDKESVFDDIVLQAKNRINAQMNMADNTPEELGFYRFVLENLDNLKENYKLEQLMNQNKDDDINNNNDLSGETEEPLPDSAFSNLSEEELENDTDLDNDSSDSVDTGNEQQENIEDKKPEESMETLEENMEESVDENMDKYMEDKENQGYNQQFSFEERKDGE